MKKIINNKVEYDDLKSKFKKMITTPEIYTFLKENDISLEEAIKYFAEFEMFQTNYPKYELEFEYGQVVLKEKKEVVNEGIYYLDEPYFHDNKLLDDISYKENPTKAKVVKEFLSAPTTGMFLIGPNGVGKTTLLVALCNYKYTLNSYRTLFVFWPDFIEKTKRFKDDNIYFINKVKTARSLIIDDLGGEAITLWSRDDILHPIISYRLEKRLPTYISSNYLLSELQKVYTFRTVESKKTKSIIEKIKGLTTVYEVGGQNLREKNQKDSE